MDEATLQRARAGDRGALDAVLAEVAPSLRRFTLRMCRSAAEADDAAQDALLAVAQNIARFEGRSSLGTWAFTLARTACGRRRRGLKNLPPVDDEPDRRAVDAEDPEALSERAELQSAIDRALAALRPEQREVVLLRDVEGLSAAESAEVLGLSVDALKSRLHRAREALREALRPVVAPEPGPRCPDVASLLSRHEEGDVDAATCAVMERHAAACPRCRDLCAGFRELLGACAALRYQRDIAPRL
jgi:RNA polymerase sigma-70 factor (ECF subfamily)